MAITRGLILLGGALVPLSKGGDLFDRGEELHAGGRFILK